MLQREHRGHIHKAPELSENFGNELQQNQRILQILKILVDCRLLLLHMYYYYLLLLLLLLLLKE